MTQNTEAPQQTNIIDFLNDRLGQMDHLLEHMQRDTIENAQAIRTEIALIYRVLKGVNIPNQQAKQQTPTPSAAEGTRELHPALREKGFVAPVVIPRSSQTETASDPYQEIIRNKGAAPGSNQELDKNHSEFTKVESELQVNSIHHLPTQNIPVGLKAKVRGLDFEYVWSGTAWVQATEVRATESTNTLSPQRLQELADQASAAVSSLKHYAQKVPQTTGLIQPVDSPTELTQPTEDKNAEFLRYFTGHTGVFARAFSPTIIAGGRGFIEPGKEGFKQFNEDAFKISTELARNWPTGFYFEEATKRQQFFLNAGNVLVWTIGINTNHPETISFAIIGNIPTKRRLNELDLIELKRVYTELVKCFKLPA